MQQIARPYRVILPDGDSFVVGPRRDEPDFVAHLTNLTAAVDRDENVESDALRDGATMGDQYRGALTVVMDLLVDVADPELRELRLEQVQRLNGVLRGNDYVTLQWTTARGHAQQLSKLRTANHVAPTGNQGLGKELQVIFRSPLPFIQSSDIHEIELTGGSGTANAYNLGNAPAYPVFYAYGSCDEFLVTNELTGEELVFGAAVADGDYIKIDTWEGTVTLNGVTNSFGDLDYITSTFFSLSSTAAEIPISWSAINPGANCKLVTRWRSAWEV